MTTGAARNRESVLTLAVLTGGVGVIANRIGLLLSAVLLVAACASLPEGFEQHPSQAWPQPEKTALGQLFGEYAHDNPALSGLRLISDPQEAFLARYGFAAQAEKTLDMQYYLWKSDTTGRLLLFRAFQAADRGVQVRLLIDDIYHSGRDHDYVVIDQHPNIQVRVFNPVGNRGLAKNLNYIVNKAHLNHRMHNKIFLVDNAVAVLGGRNIGDDYFGIDPDLNFSDLDVLAVGPVALAAGEAFDTYWNSPWAVPVAAMIAQAPKPGELAAMQSQLVQGLETRLGEIPYRVPRSHADIEEILRGLAQEMTWAPAEIVMDPLDRFESGAESAFVELGGRLLNQLESDVVIQTAYLIPDAAAIEAIRAKTAEGKTFRIMTNSLMSNNHISVHAFYRKHREALIEAGVELYEYRADNALIEHYKSMESELKIAESHAGMHTKAFVVDRRISMIGSYNMDPRSRIWNSEIGLLIHSEEFAARVLADMEIEFQPENAYRITLDENGKLVWTGHGPEGPERWTHDPQASAWKRMVARMIGWLPIEDEL